jgi:hypothetical protein
MSRGGDFVSFVSLEGLDLPSEPASWCKCIKNRCKCIPASNEVSGASNDAPAERPEARAAPGKQGAPHPSALSSVSRVFATMWATVMNWAIAMLIMAVVVLWIITQLWIWRSREVK